MIDISILEKDPTNVFTLIKLASNGFIDMTWENGKQKFYTTREQIEILVAMDTDVLCDILTRE
jgi:hypothetical protein